MVINSVYLYMRYMHMPTHRGHARVHVQITHIHSCLREVPNAGRVRHIPTVTQGMNAHGHSSVCSILIAFCTVTWRDGCESDAGFQWQVERQIHSGGRTVSIAHSAIQNERLCLELTNQETEPRICIKPFHENYKSYWNGKWILQQPVSVDG